VAFGRATKYARPFGAGVQGVGRKPPPNLSETSCRLSGR